MIIEISIMHKPDLAMGHVYCRLDGLDTESMVEFHSGSSEKLREHASSLPC